MCDQRLADGPLVCTRTDPHTDGHTYRSRSGSELGEGRHHAPEGDES